LDNDGAGVEDDPVGGSAESGATTTTVRVDVAVRPGAVGDDVVNRVGGGFDRVEDDGAFGCAV
jgi:hypothetical protein